MAGRRPDGGGAALKLTGPKETIRRARELRVTMSRPERLLWSALRKNKLGLRFRKQHPVGRYVLDFYCDSAKLCVEVDGGAHDFTGRRDAERDHWLAAQGVRTLRIPAREVLRNLDGVVQFIAIEAKAPSDPLRGPPPPAGEEQAPFDPLRGPPPPAGEEQAPSDPLRGPPPPAGEGLYRG